MSEENKKLDDAKLEEVAGGNAGQFGPIDDVHNTAYYVPHKVCNLPPGTSLCMMTYHSGGAFYSGLAITCDPHQLPYAIK
jgi:hypothetical protein